METSQEERDQIRAEVCKPIPNLSLMRLTAKAVCNDADRLAKLEDGIRALADQLEKEAYEAVPEDYAKRNMHRKYIASDCEAGGKDDAAERLRALLDE